MIYKLLSQSSGIIRQNDDGSTTYIPNDLRNTDWVLYQKWLTEGNIPLAAD